MVSACHICGVDATEHCAQCHFAACHMCLSKVTGKAEFTAGEYRDVEAYICRACAGELTRGKSFITRR